MLSDGNIDSFLARVIDLGGRTSCQPNNEHAGRSVISRLRVLFWCQMLNRQSPDLFRCILCSRITTLRVMATHRNVAVA